MGSVWRADHLTLNSPVAVKLLEPWVASDPLGQARFMREAHAAAKLRSPHVVQIFDHGVDAGTPYIVMELLEGESLATRLAREGRLSFVETARIVTHIARALSRAHAAGIVHRDLKPDNVFLVRDDDGELAKLLDFGIAKSERPDGKSEHSTSPGILVGTPYYASPEQAQGAKHLDHRSDIWSLGVIAYECLLGERPFRGDALADVLLRICVQPLPVPSQRGPVPPGFDAWFTRACARAREQRFDSAKLAASELARLCDAPQSYSQLLSPRSEAPRTRDSGHTRDEGALIATPLRTTARGAGTARSKRLSWAALVCALVLLLSGWAGYVRSRPTTPLQSAAVHAARPAAEVAPPQPPNANQTTEVLVVPVPPDPKPASTGAPRASEPQRPRVVARPQLPPARQPRVPVSDDSPRRVPPSSPETPAEKAPRSSVDLGI